MYFELVLVIFAEISFRFSARAVVTVDGRNLSTDFCRKYGVVLVIPGQFFFVNKFSFQVLLFSFLLIELG